MSSIHLRCCYRSPDAQRYGPELRKPPKALGSPSARIMTQSIGTYVYDVFATDLEKFMALAKTYVFEGRSRTDICVHNSEVKPYLPPRCEDALMLFSGCFFSGSRIRGPILAASCCYIN